MPFIHLLLWIIYLFIDWEKLCASYYTVDYYYIYVMRKFIHMQKIWMLYNDNVYVYLLNKVDFDFSSYMYDVCDYWIELNMRWIYILSNPIECNYMEDQHQLLYIVNNIYYIFSPRCPYDYYKNLKVNIKFTIKRNKNLYKIIN